MTKTQAWITGLIVFFVGVGLLVAGLAVKEAVMSGSGTFLIGVGLGALGLPRPTDVSVTPPVTTTITNNSTL